MSDTLPQYELFAIRYAMREAKRHEHFIGGDPHDGPMAMDYFGALGAFVELLEILSGTKFGVKFDGDRASVALDGEDTDAFLYLM